MAVYYNALGGWDAKTKGVSDDKGQSPSLRGEVTIPFYRQ